MDFRFIKLNFISPGINVTEAFNFSLLGMAVVFGGLTLIAIYISLLPVMLNFFSQLKNKLQKSGANKQNGAPDLDSIDDEALIAVATALHLYHFSSDDNRKITWKRHELWDSSWQRAGRFEAMNNQGHTLAPRR